jgi:hypothetical protein
MNSEDDIRQKNAAAMRNGFAGSQPTPMPGSPTERLFGGSTSTYRSASQQELMAESVVPNAPSGLPSMPDLVMSMAPKGVVPSVATPAPSGTVPTFDMPAATPTGTAAMPAAPGSPSSPVAVPVIAGTAPTTLEMEAALPADEARARSVNTMLGAARRMLKARDYGKAEEIFLQTEVLADTPELIRTAQEHSRLLEYLRTFWAAAREGVKSLKEGDELTYDGKTAKVVKHDDLNLVVKGSDNKDVVFVIDKLLSGLAVQMAERSLSMDDPTTKTVIGAFLGVDQSGDRAKSKTLLDEAAAAGAEIAALRTVIESP